MTRGKSRRRDRAASAFRRRLHAPGGTRHTSTYLWVSGLLAFALIALTAGPANAAPPAGEAYILDLPGVGATPYEPDEVREDDPVIVGASGVVGSDEEPAGRLDAIGSALAGPAGIALLIPLVFGLGLLLGRRGRSEPA